MKKLLAVAGIALLAACSTPVTHETASGRPEVTIAGATPEAAKAGIMREMVDRGFRLTRDSQFEMTFEKEITDGPAAVLLGSRYNPTPVSRISFSIFTQPAGTRVVADMAIITNPNSPYERRLPMNNNADSQKVQSALDGLAVAVKHGAKS